MTFRPNSVRPPRTAVWLVTLFTPASEAEAILGDLLEEFSHLVDKPGVASARSWYWRQSLQTIAHLAGAGFRTAPLTISAAVVGGFLLRWLFFWLSNPALSRATEAVLEKYGVYEHDPSAYIFWLTHSMLVEHLIVSMLIGSVVALAAKGREMTATITLGLVSDLLAIQASLFAYTKTGDQGILWTLPWSFAFSIATVVGGAIVRTRRSANTVLPTIA